MHPRLHAYYNRSKVKQYFKHGRALRTETIINDPNDVGVGRTLNATNWLALTRIGHETNERLGSTNQPWPSQLLKEVRAATDHAASRVGNETSDRGLAAGLPLDAIAADIAALTGTAHDPP